VIDSSQFADRVKALMVPGSRGIIDNVDDLVRLSRDIQVTLERRDDRIWIRSTAIEPGEEIELPWQRYFRVVLARIAALCNERVPESVSPYGGSGELSIPGDPGATSRAVFVNTAGEQRLELTPAANGTAGVLRTSSQVAVAMHDAGTGMK
jgi:hypothetical protein